MEQYDDNRIEKTIEWLRNKVDEANANGLIVGVSGGIDSAVVANLIKRAFPQQSMGVILPIKSNAQDVEDGIAVAQAAGLEYVVLDFSAEHNEILNKVSNVPFVDKKLTAETKRMADANLRARLRMSSIYAIANMLNYLVVGTDNAAELYTGYFTKHGDGGVDLLPLGRLLKSEVYQWARVLGVPDAVMTKKPSAGLWEGQTDEEEMGVSYDVIDMFLRGGQVSESERIKLTDMHRRTEHKRQLPPMPDW